ncbi:helix-turn-helix transcriptional regulator [Enterobacter sp.]|uniref:helix-turn-helix transcriptional regulator n=1 Tax=Enterobacter sp. TaxID=42895 RepID=UPI0029700750|nr:helix-turn-helix transcriptional regulator [Enterobacter sp.]
MNNENQSVDGGEQDGLLADRLRTLIGSRSTRAAAKAWDLSYSTLNNYLNRGTEPSLSVARQIAEREGVSVEWLACGDSKETPIALDEERAQWHVKSQPAPVSDPLEFAWSMVFSSLDMSEKEALLKLIHKEGIQGILYQSRLRADFVQQLNMLTPAERELFYTQASGLMSAIQQASRASED